MYILILLPSISWFFLSLISTTAISLYFSSLVKCKNYFLGLQSKLLKTEMEMVDFRQRYIKEKSRRMTLHNTLVVSFCHIIGRVGRLIQ